MNTHDDLLNNDEMCSFYEDDIENMCSNKEYDTCGECDTTTSEKYLRILDFRHFERFFQFSQSDRKGRKKAISDGVNVSVVLDMVSGNTCK